MDVWLYTQEVRKEGVGATKSGSTAVFFTVATVQGCWPGAKD